MVSALFNIMESEINRDFALNTMPELLQRLSTRYEVLRNVEFYDTRHVHDVKMIMVSQLLPYPILSGNKGFTYD